MTRRALWQLDAECHGPLLGSCWSAAELRCLTDKLFGGRSKFDDFALHAAAVAQCATRNKLSLALQKALDDHGAAWLRRVASTQDLPALWAEALGEGRVGAALWALWSDRRCDEQLCVRMHKDLYLLQHERVARWPADRAARQALQAENLALRDAQRRMQQRHAQWRDEAAAERDVLREALRCAREQVAARDAQIVRLQPSAPPAADLPAGRAALVQRVTSLQRQLAAFRAPPVPPPVPPVPRAAPEGETAEPVPLCGAALQAARVLCVGGRSGLVPLYRALVERHGGRFVHHDGGVEDNPHRLDAQLAAADLVVCHAGSLNHNAYARVKAHCKRHGTPCVYLDKPGAGGFARALGAAGVPADA